MALSAPIVAAIDRLRNFYNGFAYNAATNPGGMGNGGNRRNFEPALKDLADVASAVTAEISAQVAAAAASAAGAATLAGTAISGTSLSSLTVSIGAKTLTIETGRAFVTGHIVKLVDRADTTRWMAGTVTAYDPASGAMTVAVDNIAGSGAGASWAVFVRPTEIPVVDLFGGAQNITTATDVILTSSSPRVMAVSFTDDMAAVRLPDATTLPLGGPLFVLKNNGLISVPIRNAAGGYVATLWRGGAIAVFLTAKTTAAGAWAFIDGGVDRDTASQIYAPNFRTYLDAWASGSVYYGGMIPIGANRSVLTYANDSNFRYRTVDFGTGEAVWNATSLLNINEISWSPQDMARTHVCRLADNAIAVGGQMSTNWQISVVALSVGTSSMANSGTFALATGSSSSGTPHVFSVADNVIVSIYQQPGVASIYARAHRWTGTAWVSSGTTTMKTDTWRFAAGCPIGNNRVLVRWEALFHILAVGSPTGTPTISATAGSSPTGNASNTGNVHDWMEMVGADLAAFYNSVAGTIRLVRATGDTITLGPALTFLAGSTNHALTNIRVVGPGTLAVTAQIGAQTYIGLAQVGAGDALTWIAKPAPLTALSGVSTKMNVVAFHNGLMAIATWQPDTQQWWSTPVEVAA